MLVCAPAIRLVLLLLALQLVLGLIIGVVLRVAEVLVDHKIAVQTVSIAASNLLVFWLVLWFAMRRAGCSLTAVVPRPRVAPLLFLPMAVTVAGAYILLSEADDLLQRLLPAPEWFGQLLGGTTDLDGAGAVLFTVGIIAPITEEPLFRGLLLRGLLRRYRPWRAIGATAVLFAVVHLNPWQAPGALVLGVIFGWWTLRTGSIVPALLGHALANVFHPLTVDLLHWDTVPGYAMSLNQPIMWQPWWFDALGVLLLVGGVATTRFLLDRRRHHELEPLPLAPLPAVEEDWDVLSRPSTDRAPPPRPRTAGARVLSPLWRTVGWAAYVAVAGAVIFITTALAGQAIGRGPTVGAGAVLALAITAVLAVTHTLKIAVRIIARIVLTLLALLVLLVTLFVPSDSPAGRTAAVPGPCAERDWPCLPTPLVT